MSDIEQRLTRVEVTQEVHGAEIKSLQGITASLDQHIQGIERNLSQIKWLIVGGAAVLIYQALGLVEGTKAILKVLL